VQSVQLFILLLPATQKVAVSISGQYKHVCE
jgi:hypothetical protein